MSTMLRLAFLWGSTVAFVALGCAPPSESPARAKNERNIVTVDDPLVQFSLLAALAADDYVGDAPLRAVLAGGDFGVGTFDRLDGEMIVLDGVLAHIECERYADFPLGDHTLFVGRVTGGANEAGEPLLYFRGEYGGFSRE